MLKRGLIILGVVLVGLALVRTYLSHRESRDESDEREAPVVAASRIRDVDGAAGVVLDSATLARIGLGLAPLRAAHGRPEISLPGEVVPDPQSVSNVRASVAGRLATVGTRAWPVFGERLHLGEAIAQVSDARPLTVPHDGTVTRVLAQPGEIVQAGQELLQITDYGHPLVRIAWRDEAPGSPPPVLSLTLLHGTPIRVEARLVGPAGEADPLTRGAAYLYRAQRAWEEARPGQAVLGLVADANAPAGGVILPATAVVQWESLGWVYVQHGAGHFRRVRVPTDHLVAGGWQVMEGMRAGDTVVVRGAQQLLSEEFRARITVGEEVGE